MPYRSPNPRSPREASDSEGALPAGGAPLPCRILCAAYFNTGGHILEIPVGRNIRRLRKERNMTQRQLAWHLCVSVQAVSKWERGCTYPDLALLLPIARLFDVTLDELFGNEQE